MGVFSQVEIQYNAESTFLENASAPGSNTFGTRIPVTGWSVDGLNQSRMEDMTAQSRLMESRPGYLGLRGPGTFEFTTYIPGHNTATTGSLTEHWFYDLLSDGLGGGNAAGTGTTVASGANDADTFIATSGTGATVGAIYRVGAIGDARGAGRAICLSSSASGTTFHSLVGLATANAGDVIYATLHAYPTETVSGSKRFQIGFATTGAQYQLLGCQLEGLKLSWPSGGLPTATWRYRFAYWDRSAETIPTSDTLENCNTQPVTGYCFLQDHGTTTDNAINPDLIELNMEFGLANKTGPSSLLPAYGNIYGYERTSFKAEVELRLPWVTTYESPYRTDGSDTTHKHLMFTASMGNGSRSSGFYMKRGYWVDPHPTFEANDQGLLYQRLKLRAREHTETNSNLSRAPIVIFMG